MKQRPIELIHKSYHYWNKTHLISGLLIAIPLQIKQRSIELILNYSSCTYIRYFCIRYSLSLSLKTLASYCFESHIADWLLCLMMAFSYPYMSLPGCLSFKPCMDCRQWHALGGTTIVCSGSSLPPPGCSCSSSWSSPRPPLRDGVQHHPQETRRTRC